MLNVTNNKTKKRVENNGAKVQILNYPNSKSGFISNFESTKKTLW